MSLKGKVKRKGDWLNNGVVKAAEMLLFQLENLTNWKASLCTCLGGRPQRSGRQSGNRLTASWCNYSRKRSRRLSTSRSHQILCAYRTLPCWPCRTCNPGLKTRPRSAACPPASKDSAMAPSDDDFLHVFWIGSSALRPCNGGPHQDVSEVWSQSLMHRPDWYWTIFKSFLPICVLQEPAGSPRQTTVIYWPIKTWCFRNIYVVSESIFSYLTSICVSFVYVCHVSGLYTQLQKQQCTCFSTFELKHNLTDELTDYNDLHYILRTSIL